jgi:hypothetical protein
MLRQSLGAYIYAYADDFSPTPGNRCGEVRIR